MSLYLAIDAGGTGTECILADRARILARAHGGSVKVVRVTPERAAETLHDLLNEVARSAGVSLRRICSTCVGIAGFRMPAVGDWIRANLSALVDGRVMLCGDDEIALDAAFPGGSGVMVIAGTGSNIVARTGSGERVNVGGWGPVLGDEGSGYWIGHQALRSALAAWDRGETGLLLPRVAEFWHVEGLWQIVERSHALPAPDFAALAPVVSACAEEGDAVCRRILVEAGRHLAASAVLARRRMLALDPEALAGIAFTGGILRSAGVVRESMLENILQQLPGVQIIPHAVEPALGALWRARRL